MKRALISVADKRGITKLAKEFIQLGYELFSTGGTLNTLTRENIPCQDISNLTNKPEAFDGRVKTISFEVEAAILFDREKHAQEANEHGIEAIDLVVCNFYPFQEAAESNIALDTLLSYIDIGGPTMVRSAAKNHQYVTVVTDPSDYSKVLENMRNHGGSTSKELRFELACKAFNATANYEASIAVAMDQKMGEKSLRLAFHSGQSLRYGENSHQKAHFYRQSNVEQSLFDMEVHGGKELSYNNILDISSAIESVKNLNRFGCVIIKHNTPCGMAESQNQRRSIELAWQSDPISAFGSVIAFNTPVDLNTVSFFDYDQKEVSAHKFIEVILAPTFTEEALQFLQKKKNLRIITFDPLAAEDPCKMKFFNGTLLVQDVDQKLFDEISIPTSCQTGQIDKPFLSFGLRAVSHIKSNAIAIVRKVEGENYQLLGMGAGQPNRLNSIQLALDKCKKNLSEEFCGDPSEKESYIQQELAQSLLISEAFFPFHDSIDLCAKHGIKTIIQPGGSIRDKEVINKCNEHNLSMIFTGLRHFKH